jgi:Flp pilus assembly protein TadB
MNAGLLAFFMAACGLAAWQLAQWAVSLRQRRLAQARALGLLDAGRRPALKELGQALAEGLQSRLPSAWLSHLDGRLRHFPETGGAGGLLLRCLGLGLGGALLLGLLLGGAGAGLGALLGLLPYLRVADLEQRRRLRLRQDLPDALDLLTACVQAGLGLDQALSRCGAQLPVGPLRDEWLRTLDALRTGAGRRQAFMDWEARCGVEELGLVLRAILRGELRGVPLSPVLQAAAGQMRRLRTLRVQEQAAKAPVKMLLPLMLFFLPAVFLILFGPVFLKLSAMGF